MKKIVSVRIFLLMTLLVAALLAQPVQAHAQSEERLESYVNLQTFSQYVRERFFEMNEDPTYSGSQISLSQFHIPATESLLEQTRKAALFAVPELATISNYRVYSNGGEIDCIGVFFNSSSNKNNQYFYDIQRAADPMLIDIEGNASLTEAEKALLLHDRLAIWVAYDYENYLKGTIPAASYTAYGAFVNRKAVCAGYTEAYGYLLARAGIYSEYCSSDELNHAWNIVYIDGVSYHTDVTWDDPVWDTVGDVRHTNFLRSTQGLISTGHAATDFDNSPVDTTYDNAYWKYSYTAFQLIDNTLYYIGGTGGNLYAVANGAQRTVCSAGNYAQLSSIEDKLLYVNLRKVYLVDPKTGNAEAVYEFPRYNSQGYSYTGFRYERSHLVAQYTAYDTASGLKKETLEKVFYVLPGSSGWRTDRYGVIYLTDDGQPVRNRWMVDGVGWRYLGADGYAVCEQWQTDSGGWLYLGADGYIATNCWAADSAGWCYLGSNGRIVTNQWVNGKYGRYYVGPDGYRLRDSWRYDSVGWRYLGSDGRAVKECWIRGEGNTYTPYVYPYGYEDGDYYYIDESGYMCRAWNEIEDGWYYFADSGVMVKNRWVKDRAGWCYLGDSGRMISECWLFDDGNSVDTFSYNSADYSGGKLYYMDADGHMVTGWKKLGNNWYWFENSGVKAKDRWVKDSVGWCYLDQSGCMVSSCWIYDDGVDVDTYSYSTADYNGGKLYYINADGHMVTGWNQRNDIWFWFDDNGVKAKNRWLKYSGSWYYLGESGAMLTNAWREDSGGTCYMGKDGRMVVNTWVNDWGYWYYVDSVGHRVTGWRQIGGKWYYFYRDGSMATNTYMDGGWINSDGVWAPY